MIKEKTKPKETDLHSVYISENEEVLVEWPDFEELVQNLAEHAKKKESVESLKTKIEQFRNVLEEYLDEEEFMDSNNIESFTGTHEYAVQLLGLIYNHYESLFKLD